MGKPKGFKPLNLGYVKIVKKFEVGKLDKTFKCPVCEHQDAVSFSKALDDKRRPRGTVCCNVCRSAYVMFLSRLEEGIDVYSEWCDLIERKNAKPANPPRLAKKIQRNVIIWDP